MMIFKAITAMSNPNPISLFRRPISQFKQIHFNPKKQETLQSLKTHLQNCHLLAAIKYTSFTPNQFQQFRRSLPESAHITVAKNTVAYKAIEGTQWELLKPCMNGMNAWLFIQSEEISEALDVEENDFTCAVFEGGLYGPGGFRRLMIMPTRDEFYGGLLGGLQTPLIGLVCCLEAPVRD